MIWDGTSKQVVDALNRFSAGRHSADDWSVMSDVVAAAMSALEIRKRQEQLELAAGNFIRDADNDRKRMQNQIDALKQECAVLAAKLRELGV